MKDAIAARTGIRASGVKVFEAIRRRRWSNVADDGVDGKRSSSTARRDRCRVIGTAAGIGGRDVVVAGRRSVKDSHRHGSLSWLLN